MSTGRHGPSGARRALAAAIERRLADEAGIIAAVRVVGEVAFLAGIVESDAQRDAATDLAAGFPGVDRVWNDLEVETYAYAPERVVEEQQLADRADALLAGEPGLPAPALEPDFAAAPLLIGDDLTDDALVAAAEAIPYTPPTDPVVRPTADGQALAILGGFGNSAMDEYPDDLASTALGEGPPGDEDLAERVRAHLAADALTTDLAIAVRARGGVIRLRGRVPTLDDAEAVEAVAARVPGVREVVEALDVPGLGA